MDNDDIGTEEPHCDVTAALMKAQQVFDFIEEPLPLQDGPR